MFGWFKAKSPLNDDQRAWIDMRFDWLISEFGRERLRAPIITPTEEFFPDSYSGNAPDAEILLRRLCRYMDLDPKRVDLSFYTSEAADDVAASFHPHLRSKEYALGVYWENGDQFHIQLEMTRLSEPMTVVATLAHELGHVHLLGNRRCSPELDDHEPLTDLLTVFFGLGIFSANSAIREKNWSSGQWSGWSASKQGYLSGAHYAYALARFAKERGEEKPDWLRYLRRDVRAWMKVELENLTQRNVGALPRQTVSPTREHWDESEGIVDDLDSDDAGSAIPVDEDYEEAEEYRDEQLEHRLDVPVKRGGADEWFTRGVAYYSQGHFAEAVDAFAEALRLDPEDTEVLQHQADALNATGAFARAIECCHYMQTLGERGSLVYRTQGKAYLHLHDFHAAMRDLTLALKANGKDCESYFFRGLAHVGLGDYRRALTDFNKVIRISPTWGVAYLARSRAYDGLGESQAAGVDLAEAIRRQPELGDESLQSIRLAGIK